MRAAGAGACAVDRDRTSSGSVKSEEDGREMFRPRTILAICLILMAESRMDKQESLTNRRTRDKHETADQVDTIDLDKGSGLNSVEVARDRSIRANYELQDQEPDDIDFDMESGSGLTSGDLDNPKDYKLPEMDKRKSPAPKQKVLRAFQWTIGTLLTLASIILLIGTVSLTSRGTQTTGEQEENRGKCCTLVSWLTKTSSQLPMWKSLALKLFITVISTLGAGAFSLLLTNLLADREESVEQTVREILGLTEDNNTDRRRRSTEADPGKVHWLAVLFLIWLTTIPLICYIIVAKFNDSDWTARECYSPDTELGDNRFMQERRRQERRENREQKRLRTRAREAADSTTDSWPTPPSLYRSSAETPPPPFCSVAAGSHPTTPPAPPPSTNATTGMTAAASGRTAVRWFARFQKGLKQDTEDRETGQQLEMLEEEPRRPHHIYSEPTATTSG